MIDIVEGIARQILECDPGVVVRYRLLRDVLMVPLDSAGAERARDDLRLSRCIRELSDDQWADGSWGRFHSRDMSSGQKTPTTEAGVERALALGLDASDPILQRASIYIASIMYGDIPFPDRHESNDRWPTGTRLFLASTLSLIHPDHPALAAERALWQEIARRTFRSGQYSEQDEIDVHAELTGASVKGTYLVIGSKYQLNILGSQPGMLSHELEMALLRWLWRRPKGIGYLDVSLSQPPPARPGPCDRWLASLEMLSRLFPGWVQVARPAMEWLWLQRDARGYWDLGPRPGWTPRLPLSDSWRVRQDRVFDWTTRVVVLMRRYCDGGGPSLARGGEA